MELKVSVGQQGIRLGDGTETVALAGPTGNIVVSELNGRYFEQMRSNRLFSACIQASQALSVGLATTYTGLLIYNPLGSNKVLVPNKVKFAPLSMTTFAVIGLM